MNNPLLGKVFSLPNLKSHQKIILWQIIYLRLQNKEIYRNQLAEAASCDPKTVTETLKIFRNEMNFISNYDEKTRKCYNFAVNYDVIELAWATRKDAPLKPKGKRKVKKQLIIGSPVPSNEDKDLDYREPHSLLEGAPFPLIGSPVPTPIYEYINTNLTKDLLSTIDDRTDDKCHTVELVKNKIQEMKMNSPKTDEEMALEWITNQIVSMRNNGEIHFTIVDSKSDADLVKEAMFHMINRDKTKFPRMSAAGKGMLNMLKAGTWRTPDALIIQEAKTKRDSRLYDQPARDESILDLNFNYKLLPEESKIAAILGIARSRNSLGLSYKIKSGHEFVIPYLEKENLRYTVQTH